MAIINKGMSRRSFLGLTGSVAAVAGLGLTGCGGSSSDEGSASGSTDSANRGGGVITAGSAYAPSSFDPASTGSAVGLGANWHVVEGLYGIDYHDYSTFNELATDDPKSVDDTTFEVTIRKGAKFSDGTEVTADDVVASYTACAASATYAPFFQPFESIEAKDASTVTVKTKVPNFSLLKDRLAIVRVTPATQTEEDRAKQPIGSGPWMYDSISDTEITLVPNPEYNGEYAAEDKKIQYSILTDPTARVTAQQEGSTLVMELVTADAVDQLESAGLATPSFWLAVLLILLFSSYLKVLPASGALPHFTTNPVGYLGRMIMPAIALAFPLTGQMTRIVRTAMVEELDKDYVRMARGAGVPEKVVVGINVLRNALITPVTTLGLKIGYLMGGAVVIEVIFNLPGMGTAILQGVQGNEANLVQGVVIVVALAFIIINIVVDMLYLLINPRIRTV